MDEEYKKFSDLVKAQVKLLVEEATASDNKEVVEWVDRVNQVLTQHKNTGFPPSQMTKDYLEMGLRTSIMRNRLKSNQQIVDRLLEIGLTLLDYAFVLAAK